MATVSAIYRQMEATTLLAARRYKGWRFLSALRPVIAILLVALMAGNAIAGSFSGFLHSHALEDAGNHHHDGRDHSHNHGDAAGALPVADLRGVAVFDAGGIPNPEQLHGHGPIVALGLSSTLAFFVAVTRATWAPPSPDTLVLDRTIASERPPRAA